MPTSVSISTLLLRPATFDGLGRPLDEKLAFPVMKRILGDGSRLIAFSIRFLNTDKFSRRNKYAGTNDNWHHRSHRFPDHVHSPIVSQVAFAFDVSLPVRTGATVSKFWTSINLSPGSFFIRWAQSFQPQSVALLCASLVARLRVQGPSQPPKAMRKVATIPAAARAKQPRRTAINAANLAPEWM